ncbi:hypothetical protein DPMN_089988 [Dreissena polymorpha]|uniref:Uncharacterized protein n=1 Tax=Dreissena polymorpha TaxID=45954 RepID=A0A9D4KWX1_DREPO|nr:hypothetical protein DPMN_089988 [Dreissena polymorpha]
MEATANTYSNIKVAYTTRREAPVAGPSKPELVYADIDIIFLETKQKMIKKTNKYVPTEYTSVRELNANIPDEKVCAYT